VACEGWQSSITKQATNGLRAQGGGRHELTSTQKDRQLEGHQAVQAAVHLFDGVLGSGIELPRKVGQRRG